VHGGLCGLPLVDVDVDLISASWTLTTLFPGMQAVSEW
jgi:hypothetical protein